MNAYRIQFLKDLQVFGEEQNIPNVSWRNGEFLHFLVGHLQPKRILEVGMANGFSTIWMADAAEGYGGEIVCYDFSEPSIAQARENFKLQKLDHLIEIRVANFAKNPPEESEKFDFIFIDAQKALYPDFWAMAKKILAEGGLVFFDDVLKFPEKTEKFHEIMDAETDWERVILPIDPDDGVMLVRKV